MDRIRWAVIGAGGIARRRTIPEGIVPADSAELVAVYAPNSGQEVGNQFNVPSATSEAELYSLSWDALYVASPVDCHCRQVVQAAAIGRHVLCEKPLALTAAEAERMVSACEEAKVKFGTAFMMRNHAQHQQALNLVRAGTLGAVTYARAQLSCWYPPMENAWRQDLSRSGGGVIPDLASHCFDLLEMICGKRITQVSCFTGNQVHTYSVEDSVAVLLRFDDGALATVDCLFNVPDECSKNRLEIYGTQGSILAEGTIGQGSLGTLQLLVNDQASGYDAQQLRSSTSKGGSLQANAKNVYRAQIEGFSRAILQDHEPPVTGRQGLHIQKVLEACYQSANESRVVKIANSF